MTSASFSKLATVTASTKRPAAISGGKAGEPTTNIASLKCTPLIAASRELIQMSNLQTTGLLYVTKAQSNLDIKTEDILVIDTVEYPIRAVTNIPFAGDMRKRMIVESPKR